MKLNFCLGPLTLTISLLMLNPATGFNVICYFSSWAKYRPLEGSLSVTDIDPDLCTHINYAFVDFMQDGTMFIADPWESYDEKDNRHFNELSNLKTLKTKNPKLKVFLSLGGWNGSSKNFSVVAADSMKTKRLAWEVLALILKYKFDGVDIFWEYPTLSDKENLVNMLNIFKTMYTPRGLLVSTAVAGTVDLIQSSYYVEEISGFSDMLNIMSYDYHGVFENFVGHMSPLHASSEDFNHGRNSTKTVATGVEYWLYKNADPQKINMGIATYGKTLTLADESNFELYAPVIGPGEEGPYTTLAGYLGYNEICQFYSNWSYFWDDEQKVPHRVWQDQWIGFEDKTSIEFKVDFAVSHNLGGIMIRSLDTDDFLGMCGEKYHLTNTVKNRLAYHENKINK